MNRLDIRIIDGRVCVAINDEDIGLLVMNEYEALTAAMELLEALRQLKETTK